MRSRLLVCQSNLEIVWSNTLAFHEHPCRHVMIFSVLLFNRSTFHWHIFIIHFNLPLAFKPLFSLSGATQAGSSLFCSPGLRMLCPPAVLLWWHLQMGGGQSNASPARGLGHLPGPVSESLRCSGKNSNIRCVQRASSRVGAKMCFVVWFQRYVRRCQLSPKTQNPRTMTTSLVMTPGRAVDEAPEGSPN